MTPDWAAHALAARRRRDGYAALRRIRRTRPARIPPAAQPRRALPSMTIVLTAAERREHRCMGPPRRAAFARMLAAGVARCWRHD